MKALLIAVVLLSLCACSSVPTMHTSVHGGSFTTGPTSIDDPRLRSPEYYMDDDNPMANSSGALQTFTFRGVDNFCMATCQSSRHSAEYCNRSCGFYHG